MKISQLLSKESNWTKGAMARDKDGKAVNCLDVLHLDQGRRTFDLAKHAVSFSLYGAISSCYDQDKHEEVTDKIHKAMLTVFRKDMYIAIFNDDERTTFQDIKEVVGVAGV